MDISHQFWLNLKGIIPGQSYSSGVQCTPCTPGSATLHTYKPSNLSHLKALKRQRTFFVKACR